ncbi:MAG: hypothetical protein KDI54_01725 [Gammaproteobacteria bacterium]|nr:hypothetical protein [Gammaproteobacteria bacterium]
MVPIYELMEPWYLKDIKRADRLWTWSDINRIQEIVRVEVDKIVKDLRTLNTPPQPPMAILVTIDSLRVAE